MNAHAFPLGILAALAASATFCLLPLGDGEVGDAERRIAPPAAPEPALSA